MPKEMLRRVRRRLAIVTGFRGGIAFAGLVLAVVGDYAACATAFVVCFVVSIVYENLLIKYFRGGYE